MRQISSLAVATKQSVERMFRPFWDSIAIIAVKDLLVKPQTSQLMSDLLNSSVKGFLDITQTFTLPYLVVEGRVDIIHKINQACQVQDDYVICLDPKNLIPILSLLMIQSVPDLEKYICHMLRATSPRFKEFDLLELTRTEPAALLHHLLKMAGDAVEQKKGKVCIILQNSCLFC